MSKKKTGIYQILCRPTGKSYVGSSRNIYSRWSAHRSALRAGKNGCWRLQRAWSKHGESAFEFSVLEECCAEELDTREQFYIDRLNPLLNIVRNIEVGAVALAIAANRIRYAAITHCPHGHVYDDANTYIDRNGSKICRACNANRVAAIKAVETPEEREKRLAYDKESYYKNHTARRAQQHEYVLAHKAEKAEYDRKHRVEHARRQRERLRNHTPEEHAAYLEKKRLGYHLRKVRNAVQSPLGEVSVQA